MIGYTGKCKSLYTGVGETAGGPGGSLEEGSTGPRGAWRGPIQVRNITEVSGDVLWCSAGTKWVQRDDPAVTDHPYLHAIQQSAIQHAIQHAIQVGLAQSF